MALSNQEKKNIQIVWNGLDAILKEKSEIGIEANFAQDFIQHNPWAGDTIVHLKEMLQMDFGYEPKRWISDGDIMSYQGYYTAPNPLGELPLLCTDMWRIENGKVQEHWDALMPVTNEQLQHAIEGNGDGEKEVSEELRKSNKALVKRFLDHVFNRGRLDQIEALVSKDYVYHHRLDGVLHGQQVIEDQMKRNGGRMLHDNKLLLSSGDLVMAHSHYFGENERVVFDWFRLEEGKIVEHWTVEQSITPLEEVANDHPHF